MSDNFPPLGIQLLVLQLCVLICFVAAVGWSLHHRGGPDL